MDWYGTNGDPVENVAGNENQNQNQEKQGIDLIGLLWLLAIIAILKYIFEKRR